MSSRPCGGCSRPVSDAFLCTACSDDLRDRLYGVRALVDDLEITLCRMARVGSDGSGLRVRSAETPLAFNWSAAEGLWLLDQTFGDWATVVAVKGTMVLTYEPSLALTDPKDPARIFPPRGRTVLRATFLARHINVVAALPEVGVMLDQVDYALATAMHVVDRAPERAYAGPCREDTEDGPCPGELYTQPRALTVVCPGCGAEHDMDARRAWLLEQAQHVLVTATEASRALPGMLGKPVTASMIRGHARRGKLAPHPGHPGLGRGPNGKSPTLYRLGEIVAVLVAEETAREARTPRHPPRPSPQTTPMTH